MVGLIHARPRPHRVAVIGDVHSNVFALAAVLREVGRSEVREVWLCGDAFGYYPWASATFRALLRAQPLAVLGNHDRWVLRADLAPANLAGGVARHNARELRRGAPSAFGWLAGLAPRRSFERSGWAISLAHGTPTDPFNGRYYPDDHAGYGWLPRPGQIVILGQTHHPLVRGEAASGLVLNPGSVGQPRDGDPGASWALLDLGSGRAHLRRTSYDHARVMARLAKLGWDEGLISALGRRERASHRDR